MDEKSKSLKAVSGLKGIYTRTLADGDITYYVSVRMRDGRWTFRSVGKHSKGMRPKAAVARQAVIQKEIDHACDPKTMQAVTFGDAFAHYLRKRQAKGGNTVRDEERWRNWLQRFERVPLSKLRTHDFEEMQRELRGKGRAEGYQEKILGQARTIFAWAIKDDLWHGKNPLGRESSFVMPSWRKSGKPTKWFTPDEASALLEAIRRRSEHWYRMSLLSLRTGMRAMEIFGLGEQDNAIDEAAGRLWFTGKSGAFEFVEADAEIIALLKEYNRKPGDLIFQKGDGGRITQVSATFARALQDCGIVSTSHKIWFHSWRHTFGSWLAQSGKFTLHEIMVVMRHSDVRMTQHYAKLIPGNMGARLDIIAQTLDAAGDRQR